MTSIAESPDCHRGLVRGCITQMVKYYANCLRFKQSGLSCQFNRRFQIEGLGRCVLNVQCLTNGGVTLIHLKLPYCTPTQ